MTATENSYTMPLLFGVCRKQGHNVLCISIHDSPYRNAQCMLQNGQLWATSVQQKNEIDEY